MRKGDGARSRREFLRLAGAAAAGAVLGACAPRSALPSEQSGPVHLVYQDWRTEWFPAMAREMLQRFHASHPNIRVFYTPDPEDLEARMLTDFEAGIPPDVFQGSCTHFASWAQLGYTLDLRPYVVGSNSDYPSVVGSWHSTTTRICWI
jgi:ABC-type glycerol-3-phosphate transport system substrate-binding protein